MARVITPAEIGVTANITLLTSLIQIIVNLGLNSSIAKFKQTKNKSSFLTKILKLAKNGEIYILKSFALFL